MSNNQLNKYNYLTSQENRSESINEASKIAYEIAELLSNKNISYYTASLALDLAKEDIKHAKLGKLKAENKMDK